MDENRPNPEDLLKQIEALEAEESKKESMGKLKIFLGFCAGVGKTYAMLEEMRTAVSNGIDAQIGIVETHGRVETEALLEGLPIIPRKKINYNGFELDEMDIDKILEIKPKLVIVDELAHTNVHGSRHAKRYQDVEEILKAGIDVYTTLNIQHVESVIDVVQQISNVEIHETVPDSILELAEQIELVDLPTEKLLERLKDGKIYIPDRAKTASKKFFRKGNLLALRELALRYTAKRVDDDIVSYKNKNAIRTPWHVNSKLLVGFSASPTSERLLRITHRMASDMNAEWYAVYVESPQQVEINEQARNQLDKNIRLAEELNAKVVSLSGNIIADEIINFAKEKNITLIVAGLSHRSRIEEIFKGSVLNDLTKKSGQINVLIVGSDGQKVNYDRYFNIKKGDYKPYIISFISIAAIISFGYMLIDIIEPFNTGMMLMLPIILGSIFWGTRVGLFSSVIAIAGFDFFLIHPQMTFNVANIKYLPSFIVFIAVSLIVSLLSKEIRNRNENAKHRERFLSSLYYFSRDIMQAQNLNEILNKVSAYIKNAFECEIVILLPDKDNNLDIAKQDGEMIFGAKENAVANWVFKNGTPAGKNTQTLSSTNWYFMPLKVENTTVGVLSISFEDKEKILSSEQQRLLESFSNIIAVYMK